MSEADDQGEITASEEEHLLSKELMELSLAIENEQKQKDIRKAYLRQQLKDKKEQLMTLKHKGKSLSKHKIESDVTVDKKSYSFIGSKCNPSGVKSKAKVVISSEDSSSSSSSDADMSMKGSHHKGKKKSGIAMKSSDKVKRPQVWPHSVLQNEYVSRDVKFHDLTFSQFIAGELEIIDNPRMKECERKGRLSFLKKIVYYNEIYEWRGLLELYAAWVRKIEVGKRGWGDDPSELEVPILTKYVKTSRHTLEIESGIDQESAQLSDVETDVEEDEFGYTWFCPHYQRNKCDHDDAHFLSIRGQMRKCQHICATCWRSDRKRLKHPDCATECPNRYSYY